MGFTENIHDTPRVERDEKLAPKLYAVLVHSGIMSNARVVLTTAGSEEEARKIAHALVERRLAACVNIVPRIESVYRWQGKVESATEWLLIVKTGAPIFDRVRDAIREIHSYELPECIMLEIPDGDKAYLDWLATNTD